MEDPQRLRELAASVQKDVDAYIQRADNATYKSLQNRLIQLQVAATKPADILYSFRAQAMENIAIVILIETGVLDALVEKRTATAAELAEATGCNEVVIARLMRMACALIFCDEVGETTYQANTITSLLVNPGWKGSFRWAEILYPPIVDIRRFLYSTDYVRTGDQSAPCALEFATGRGTWKILEDDPEMRQGFDLFMSEMRKHEEQLWHKNYPPSVSLSNDNLKSNPDSVLMVDIGGGLGHQLMDFKSQFPNLPGRCVLQDVQVGTAGKYSQGIEVMQYDFLTPQPVKGARFYYFRHVLHNWSDDKCLEILRNVVEAMEPDYSTLLIEDYVLPDTGCQSRAAIVDILMMITLNSMERTEKHYGKLLDAAGLELVNTFATGTNEEAILEAKIRKT